MASDEAEFVRLVRDADVLIRPRYAAGRTDVVVGYSVAERPVDGASPVWYGGGRLARDLTLPRLREGWPDSPVTAQDAVDEWRTRPNPWLGGTGRDPRGPWEPSPQLWAKYTEQMKDVVEQLRAVPLDDRSAWAHVARDAAGVFFSWSRTFEKDKPGPLADAGRQLARSAHVRARVSRPKPVRFGSMSGAARLLAAASVKNDAVAIALLAGQLMRAGSALVDMHTAAGEARTAAALAQSLEHALVDVHARLPERTLTAPESTPQAEAAFDMGAWRAAMRDTGEGVDLATDTHAASAAEKLVQARAWAAEHDPALAEYVTNTLTWSDSAEARATASRHVVSLWESATTEPVKNSPSPERPVVDVLAQVRDAGVEVRTWAPGKEPSTPTRAAAQERQDRHDELRSRVRFDASPVSEASADELVQAGPYKGLPVFPEALHAAGIDEVAWRTAQGHFRPKGSTTPDRTAPSAKPRTGEDRGRDVGYER